VVKISQGGRGRDHNARAQMMWLGRAGIRIGTIVGETDELGDRAVKSAYHLPDLHATILRLMGLDDMRLTFYFNGPELLTDGERRGAHLGGAGLSAALCGAEQKHLR
jgi:hypothetical protein